MGEYPPTMADLRNVVLTHGQWPAIFRAKTEVDILSALGFATSTIARLVERAKHNGTTVENEMLYDGAVEENTYYRTIADYFHLAFLDTIDPAHLVDMASMDTQLVFPYQVRLTYPNRMPQIAIVPRAEKLSEFASLLTRLPELASTLVVTTPSALRRAVWAAGSARRVRKAASELFELQPDHSARIVATGRQGLVVGTSVTATVCACIMQPQLLLPLVHATVSLAYLASLSLRFVALFQQKYRKRPPKPAAVPAGPPPDYTVMVAIYREAGMVGQLVSSLERLEWPRSRLDIKLVCEEDDTDTLAALAALHLPVYFEVVTVPPYHPRTKPKALAYALPAARGEFLAIFDAEDRPHPHQLIEAYERFRASGPELACLQAPLIIANVDESYVSTLFAVEYAALFRGLLPMLARYRMPLPLGGTSNHFRTAVLRKVGGWDPFNVTEDADLGLRLYRLGYRSETLRCQTLEDAPVSLPIWTGQRIRWFKGWLQTWLVLTRNPILTGRQMGLKATIVFHLMIGGMLLSALLHPLILLFMVNAGLTLIHTPLSDIPGTDLALMLLDTSNVLGSYITFLGLGVGSMIGLEKLKVGHRWLAVPLHWMMTSYAAWRALNELRTNPFFWKKTPHRPTRKR